MGGVKKIELGEIRRYNENKEMQIEYKKYTGYAFGIAFALILTSCQKSTDVVDGGTQQKEEQNSESESPSEIPKSPSNPASSGLSICSRLNFSDVSFPPQLDEPQKNSFALALNVTGSFEGHLAWTTIANNSDGMGISLGLLQQNFGSGTLQPMLIEMRNNHPMSFASAFSAAHFSSLGAMLRQWENAVGPSEADIDRLVKEKYLFVPDEYHISDLDEEEDENDLGLRAISKNQISVNWAVNNVLSGSQIRADWKQELMALAGSKDYRDLQLKDALQYHKRTLDYLAGFEFTQMRFYLMLFDFVIQNGGFQESHWNEYVAYRRKNPDASEEQRAMKLIEIRVASVRSQYKADVRSRKMTIVKGKGVVHGQNRQLAKEYCYEPQYIVR